MSPHEKYKSNIINTATKEQKMVIIFNEITKVLNKAIKCIQEEDFEGKNTNLRIAADTFYNLRLGIDVENGGDFAKHLEAFCYSVYNKIEAVNLETVDASELNNIIDAIAQVKELFKDEQPSA